MNIKCDLNTRVSRKRFIRLLALTLGDGCISIHKDSRSPNYTGYVFGLTHCMAQKNYAQIKVDELCKILNSSAKLRVINNSGYPGVQFSTSSYKLKSVYEELYPDGKKTISRKILNMFSPKELAIWYMDDGGLGKKIRNGKMHAFDLMINTHTTKEENQVIIDYFIEVWNIKFTQVLNKGKYRIRCGTREARKFIDLVKSYILPEFEYKVNPLID